MNVLFCGYVKETENKKGACSTSACKSVVCQQYHDFQMGKRQPSADMISRLQGLRGERRRQRLRRPLFHEQERVRAYVASVLYPPIASFSSRNIFTRRRKVVVGILQACAA